MALPLELAEPPPRPKGRRWGSRALRAASFYRALSPAQRGILRAEILRAASAKDMHSYRPYWKQAWFHTLGAAKRERLLIAGNQLGKTYAAAHESALHLTGLYPPWWTGKRFADPVTCWASGVTGVAVRNNAQKWLLGDLGRIGEGLIPGHLLPLTRGTYGMARGTADLYDYALVKHVSGGLSKLQLLYYSQEREKWQGPSIEVMWFDEEPPQDIYTEGMTRTNATGGIVMLSYTPLKGMSEVTERFLMEESDDRGVVTMVIEDALRKKDGSPMTTEDIRRIVESYPVHERDARTRGIPILGSGRVFPLPDDDVAVQAFKVPDHWPLLGGMDFGWDHPTAAVKLAWDRDADVIYVTHTYRKRETTPKRHAEVLAGWGGKLPWAWPHDGAAHEKGSGIPIADQYRSRGMKMMPVHAQMEKSGEDDTPTSRMSVEAGVGDMLMRMQAGKFKVFSHLQDWFEEFRLYHRDKGRIVPKKDDLMDASRYAAVSLRFSELREGNPDWNARMLDRGYDWQAGV